MPRKHSDNKKDVRKQVRLILPRLRGKRLSTRIKAIRDLGLLGPLAAYAAGSLLPFVEDLDEVVRSSAMWALGEIGVGNKAVSSAVRELLTNDVPNRDPYTKGRAYWILERIET